MVTQAIGFSNYYYTLWSIKTEPQYIVDNYGNRFLLGYNYYYYYQKNISMDLEKALKTYPDLEFNEDLRGINGLHWHKENKEDLCPNIMKFGKYYKHNIDEVVLSDFEYILWVCENMQHTPNGKYALSIQRVIDHYNELSKAENEVLQKRENIFQTLLSDGTIEFTPENNLKINDDVAYIYLPINGIFVTFQFPLNSYRKMTYGGFEYGLPLFNGKAKRIKTKRIKLLFEKEHTREFTVNVKHIEML